MSEVPGISIRAITIPSDQMNNRSDKPETRYWFWIQAIAHDIDRGACPEGILEHIQKHAGPDLLRHVINHPLHPTGGRTGFFDWRRWSASMHNLLEIFDLLFLDEPITVEEKLQRLREHYERHPESRTPEPIV